jgi:hypothetical protein
MEKMGPANSPMVCFRLPELFVPLEGLIADRSI